MTTRAELEALAERVETEEPSRELRDAIGVALEREWTVWADWLTSLDAADSLRPKGWHPDVWYAAREQVWRAVLEQAGKYVRVTATSPTEARARTAAAIRAIAQEARND